MQSRTISLLFDSALALTGAAAIWFSPISPLYAALVVAAAAAGALRDLRGGRFLPRHLLTAAGLAGFLAALLPLRREFLAEQSLAALAVLLAVKLLAGKKRRDHLQVLALAGVVTVGAGSLAPELAFASLILIVCVLGTFHLVWLPFSDLWNLPGPERGLLRRLTGIALGLMAFSVPVAFFLFLLLPRSVNPYWRGFGPAERRVSGFSDEVDLGGVGRLALSGDVAFRAEMVSPRGPLDRIPYWRGIILEQTDGRRWSTAQGAVAIRPVPVGEAVQITYYVEPHGEHQLFLLEQPSAAYIAFRIQPLADGGVLRLRSPLYSRIRYLGLSTTSEVRPEGLSEEKRRRNLQLPEGFSPAIRALAAQVTGGAAGERQIVERALSFFASGFTYTLDVPPPVGDPLEHFLLTSRRGYCEHFASSLAVMLRASGVPCRLVAGYLGGEYNANGGYYIVSQSAAHTWVEAWIEGEGWRRLDPTPAAGELGGTFASLNAPPSRLWLDALRMKWNSWVVQYDAEVQMDLLRKGVFGLAGLRLPRLSPGAALRWILVLPPALLLLLLARRWRRGSTDPLGVRYDRFNRRLARAGVPREPWEGPVDFGRRAAGTWPEAGPAVLEFTGLWASLRYGRREAERRELLRLDEILRILPRRRNPAQKEIPGSGRDA